MKLDLFEQSFITGRSAADIIAINQTFLREAAELGLAFECFDCAHWDPADVSCSMGYPFRDLLDVRGLREGVPATGAVLHQSGYTCFCKHFEPL